MRLARIFVAVFVFAVAGVVAAQPAPAAEPYEFEGEFLVAVTGSDAPPPEAGGPEAAEAPSPLRFERLFSTTQSAPAGGPEGAPETPEEVTWFKVTVSGPESASADVAQQHPWDLAHDAIDGKSSNARLNALAADARRRGLRVTEIEPNV